MPSGVFVRSEETRQKISEALKGHAVSKATRKKISKNNCRHWKGKTRSEETKKKISESIGQGAKNPNWKGGRIKTYNGYIWIHKPEHPFATSQGYVLEQRIVMEGHLGRLLSTKEVVHHIDGNKENNEIGNLMLFPGQKEHVKAHKFGQLP